jgi:hypothetical protein
MVHYPAKSRSFHSISHAVRALALALCLSTGAYAQEQQSQPQDDQRQQTQDGPPRPTYAPQDADKPPYSHDHPRQSAPEGHYQAPPPVQPIQPVPNALTVLAGTILTIRTNDFLSTDQNQVGDPFTATLDQPLIVNGWVVARRGQTIVGKVKDVRKAGRVKGTSELGVELTDITIVDGRQLPMLTELWKGSGGTSHGQDAATIVTTTGVGAAIGAVADWGRGAAIGAGAGAAAGIAAVLLTRGRPTIVPPETQLSFRLVDPVKIDTTQSHEAFLPVSQEDYEGGRRGYRGGPRVAGGYPGPYPYPYPYSYYGPYYYPYPYFGFYYGGWGRGYYGRRGFYH